MVFGHKQLQGLSELTVLAQPASPGGCGLSTHCNRPGHIHGSGTSCVMNPTLGRYLDTGAQDSSGTICAREARDGACLPGHMAAHWHPRDHTSSSTSPSTQITSRFLSLGLPCKMGVGHLLAGSVGWTGHILTGWAVPHMQGQIPEQPAEQVCWGDELLR